MPKFKIKTVCLNKVGSFFYLNGEKFLLFPENFHLADGVYYVNVVNEVTYGDRTFHHINRIIKAATNPAERDSD